MCPAHDDHNNSLSIADGDNGGLLVHCHAGCSQASVIEALARHRIAVAPSRENRATKPKVDTSGSIAKLEKRGFKIIARHKYRDAVGTLLYENVRLEHPNGGGRVKTFRLRHPDGAGGWIESIKGVPRVPYRLPELLQSGQQDVHVTEGEKCADRLAEMGLIAISIASTDCDLSGLMDRVVYIHEDNDAPGRQKAADLAAAIKPTAAAVHIVRYTDLPEKSDVFDWLDQGHGLEDLLGRCDEAESGTPSEASRTPAPDWPELTKFGTPRARSQPNIQAFLGWRGAALKHNDFTLRYEITVDGKTTELGEDDLRALRLEADALGLSPRDTYFNDVCLDLARRNSHHPVRDYLDALCWDGKPRLDTWLSHYASAEDSELTRTFGRKHLVAAARRVRHQGCKHDVCLVLEGPQGVGKSSLVHALAGDAWFTDSVSVGSDSKVMIEQTAGAWLVEIAELSGIRRCEVEAVKAMISRKTDRARPAYGRVAKDVPRQFVFFGTVNDSEYLRDATGNRRFWPVKVSKIDLAALKRDRDQLWAEAAHYEAQGEPIELPPSLYDAAAREQASRQIGHPWLEILEPLLADKVGAVTVEAVWQKLDMKADRRNSEMGRQLTSVMRQLGYTKDRVRLPDGERPYVYTNAAAPEEKKRFISLDGLTWSKFGP